MQNKNKTKTMPWLEVIRGGSKLDKKFRKYINIISGLALK